MLRKLLLGLSLLPFVAQADIAFHNSVGVDANNTSLTLTENSGATAGDFLKVFCMRASNTDDGTWDPPDDFVQIFLKDETQGNTDMQMGAWYKFRGADAGNGYQFSFGGTSAAMACLMQRWSGVHVSSPLDVTYVEGSHYNAGNNAITTAARAITTATNGAVVVLLQAYNQSITTVGAPSGYTQRSSHPTDVTTLTRHVYSASKLVATAGTLSQAVITGYRPDPGVVLDS